MGLTHRNTQENVKNNHLAQTLEIWYRGYHRRALQRLLNCWPQDTKKLCCTGFGFELLNSDERFRAILALR